MMILKFKPAAKPHIFSQEKNDMRTKDSPAGSLKHGASVTLIATAALVAGLVAFGR